MHSGVDTNTKCVAHVHFLYGLPQEQRGNGSSWSRSGTRSVWIGVRPIAEAQFGNWEARHDAPGDCAHNRTQLRIKTNLSKYKTVSAFASESLVRSFR